MKKEWDLILFIGSPLLILALIFYSYGDEKYNKGIILLISIAILSSIYEYFKQTNKKEQKQ